MKNNQGDHILVNLAKLCMQAKNLCSRALILLEHGFTCGTRQLVYNNYGKRHKILGVQLQPCIRSWELIMSCKDHK